MSTNSTNTHRLSLSPLHLAALNGNQRSTRAYIKQGYDVNVQDPRHGFTPLMLACLAGAVKVVRKLVGKGARSDIKDSRGHDAGAYAKAHIEKRIFDALKSIRADLDSDSTVLRRKALAQLLRSSQNFQLHSETDLAATDYIWLKQDGEIVLLAPQARLPIPASWKNKTTACIIGKGNIFPDMFAVSGYGGVIDSKNPLEQFLNNEKFTQLVMNFCRLINFSLPGKLNDNGAKKAEPEHQGRWFAGHCEKKLAIYWLLKCLRHIARDDPILAVADDNSLLLSHEHLSRLRKNLPSALRSAAIILDRNPCVGGQGKCVEFLIKIRELTGVDIWFEVKPSVGALGLVKIGKDRHWRPLDETHNDSDLEEVDDKEFADADEQVVPKNNVPDRRCSPQDQQRGEGLSDTMVLNPWEKESGTASGKGNIHAEVKHTRRLSVDSGGGEVRPSKRTRTAHTPVLGSPVHMDKPLNPEPVKDFSASISNPRSNFYYGFEGGVKQLLQPKEIVIDSHPATAEAPRGALTISSDASSYSETLEKLAKERRKMAATEKAKSRSWSLANDQKPITPPNRRTYSPPLRPTPGVSDNTPVVIRQVDLEENVFHDFDNGPNIDKRSIATNLRYQVIPGGSKSIVRVRAYQDKGDKHCRSSRTSSPGLFVSPELRSFKTSPSPQTAAWKLPQETIHVGGYQVSQYHPPPAARSSRQHPVHKTPTTDLTLEGDSDFRVQALAAKSKSGALRAPTSAKPLTRPFDVSRFKNDNPLPRGVGVAIKRLSEVHSQMQLCED